MNHNLLKCSLLAVLSTAAFAQNTLDDYPNLPPGAALAIQANGTAAANGRINSATDLDVFTFFVATPSVLTVYTTGNTDTNGVLRRPGTSAGTAWTVIATEEGGTGNFRISRQVEPGQYSIQVGGKLNTAAAGGEYALKIELAPVNQPTPADIDVPGAPRDGTVSFGTTATGTFITRTFTIGNTGGSALNVTGISVLPVDNTVAATALPFIVDGGGARTIAAGSSSTFAVRFRPTQAGEARAMLRIVSSDPDENPWLVTLTGTGQVVEPPPPAGPEIAATQGNADLPLGATVNFGLVPVPANGDVVREVVISNRGDADLNLGNVRLELLPLGSPLPSAPEGFFKVLTQPAPVVAPGRSTVIRFGAGMTMPPASTLTRYAVWAIFENNDADENPYRLTLNAEVQPVPPPLAGEIELAAGDTALTDDGTFDMGTTATGTALSKTFTIRNTGEGNLLVSNITANWAGPIIAIFPPPVLPFIVEGGSARTIAPGASSEFRVIFKSTVAGEFEALLNIASSDADENPFGLTLKAKAEGDLPVPAAEIGVASEGADLPPGGTLDFGQTSLTVAVRRTIQVSNTGTGPLNVRFAFQPVTRSNTATPQFFRFASPLFTTVPAGATKPLTLSFQPMIAGAFETVLVISNNDADENPYRLKLTGKGGTEPARVPDIALSLGTAGLPQGALVDFGTADPGKSVTREIRIANTGTGDLKLGRITLSRPPSSADPAAGANAAGILPPLPSPLPFRALPPPNGVVPAGGSAILRVVFMAPPFGVHNAVLAIESNDADESPYRLNLRGTSSGNAPAPAEIEVSTGAEALPIGGVLDFGTVAIGTPARRSVVIANTGTGELRISSFLIMPGENGAIDAAGGFAPTTALVRVVSGAPVVPAGGSSEFVLEMIGFAPGTSRFAARIGNNDSDENPYGFSLTGKVEAPVVVDPAVAAQ